MKKIFLLLFLTFAALASEFTLPRDVVSDEQIRANLAEVFKGKNGDYFKRSIKRVGNNTILFESFISLEADRQVAPRILSDVAHYNNWALTNINKAPGSNLNYLLKIYRFLTDPKEPNMVDVEFMVDLPAFRKLSHRKFEVKTEQKSDVFTVTSETPADPKSHIEKATCSLKLFPSNQEGRVWLYVTANIKIRYWLLYEALPTRILEKESMERIQIVLDNYQAEETRIKKNQ